MSLLVTCWWQFVENNKLKYPTTAKLAFTDHCKTTLCFHGSLAHVAEVMLTGLGIRCRKCHFLCALGHMILDSFFIFSRHWLSKILELGIHKDINCPITASVKSSVCEPCLS